MVMCMQQRNSWALCMLRRLWQHHLGADVQSRPSLYLRRGVNLELVVLLGDDDGAVRLQIEVLLQKQWAIG
jgi:hypothetical protein